MLIATLLFFWLITIYFVSLTGVDRVVTGKINPNVKPEIFHAYVLWQSILNQSVAAMATGFSALLGFSISRLVLIYATVSWCWFGGGLDFVYFAMGGEMPHIDKIWHWMPFNPTTKQFAMYAVSTLILLVIGWLIEVGGLVT
jgi:hypothetical protein